MEVLNDKVNPPILVVGRPTRSLNYWSENSFIDPADNVPFREEDLTPEELGHVYLHKVIVGQWIQIYMPYKLMDKSTGRLVHGLRSYKSCSPYLNGRLPERQLKNPKSCLQHFRLSKGDFSVFSSRVSKIKGTLVHDQIDVDALHSRILNLINLKDTITEDILNFRYRACRVSSEKFYNSEEELLESLEVFKVARKSIEDFNKDFIQIALEIDRLSKEIDRDTEKIRIDSVFSTLKEGQAGLNSLTISRFEREAIHKSKVDLGIDTNTEVPAHVRSLAHEINELKAYYPCLSRLRVLSNDEVAIDLTGVDITLKGTSVIVRGDPGALSVYKKDNEIVENSNRRRRNIMIPFQKENES